MQKNCTKGCVSKFKSIHFETAFVYLSFVPQEYVVVSVCSFEQDDDSKLVKLKLK